MIVFLLMLSFVVKVIVPDCVRVDVMLQVDPGVHYLIVFVLMSCYR